MPIQALYGAEHGSTAGLVTGTATTRIFDVAVGTLGTDIQVTPLAAKNGTYGLRISGANKYVGWNTNTLGASPVHVVAFWFRITAQPSGNKEIITWDSAQLGADISSLDYDPSTGLVTAWAAGTTRASLNTFNVGQWYYIECRYDFLTDVKIFDWRIDGVVQPGASAVWGVTGDSFTLLGIGDQSGGVSAQFDYDDIVVSVTSADYPLGRHKVVKLSPDSSFNPVLSGTATNFRTFAGATPTLSGWVANVARVAILDTPPNLGAAQDGWAQTVLAGSDYVEMPLTTYALAPGEMAVAGRVLVCAWGAAATGILGVHTYNGTTDRTLYAGNANANNTATPAWICAMLASPDADLNTQAKLDALTVRAGYSTNVGSGVGVHTAYVELAIREANIPARVTATTAIAIPSVSPDVGGDVAVGAKPVTCTTTIPAPRITVPPTVQVFYGAENGTFAGLATGVAGNGIFDFISDPTPGTDVKVLAAAARRGGYGLRITNTSRFVTWNSGALGAGRNVAVVGFWFRISTNTTGVLKELLVFDQTTNSGTKFAALRYSNITGLLQANVTGNVATAYSLAPLAVNVWYYITCRLSIGTTSHILDWQLNGVDQPTVTSTGQPVDTLVNVNFGDRYSGNTSGAFDFDDIAVSVTALDYPLPAYRVAKLGIDPAAAFTVTGDAANFRLYAGATPTLSAFDATTARTNVGEIPPVLGSSQSGWCQVVNAANDYVEMPLTSVTLAPGEKVAAARLQACVWSQTTGSANMGLRSFNGTAETILYPGASLIGANNTAAPAWVSKMLAKVDVDTQAKLDALVIRAGYQTVATTNPGGLHALYVEVLVAEPVAAPVVVTAFATIPAPILPAGPTEIGPVPLIVTSAVPVPAISAGVGVTVASVGATTAVPGPAPAASSTVDVATITVGSVVPAPEVSASSTVVAVVVAATATVPEPVSEGGVGISPSVVAATAAVATPLLVLDINPAAVSAKTAIPGPVVALFRNPPNVTTLYGAEHGSTAGLLTGANGQRIFDTAVGTLDTDIRILPAAAKSGTYGLRISGANKYVGWDTTTLVPGRSLMVVGFWFRVTTQASGLKQLLVWDLNTAGVDRSSLKYDPATGKLRAVVSGTTLDSTQALTVGTWYWIDCRYTTNATNHTFYWQINGIDQPSGAVIAGQVVDTFTGLAFGDKSSGATAEFDFDDIIVAASFADYPLGSYKVVKLGVDPAAPVTFTGNPANFRTFAGATPTLSAWNATTARDAILEVPPSLGAAQSGWAQTTTATGDFVEMPLASLTLTAAEKPVAGRLLACLWGSPGGYIQLRTWNGVIERILYGATPNANNTTTPVWVCNKPAAVDVDTQEKLDAFAIRAGYSSLAAAGVGLHAIYLEIAIKEGAAPTPAVVRAVTTIAAPAVSADSVGLTVTVVPATSTIPTAVALSVITPITVTAFATIAGALIQRATTVAVGQVSETDLARPCTRLKTQTTGGSAESDLAQPLTSRKTKVIGQASETDLAHRNPRRVAVGQAAETDLAPPLGRQTRLLGRASELDTATGVSAKAGSRVNGIDETDLAQPLTSRKTKPVGQAGEADLAQALVGAKQVLVGLASELDQARPVAHATSRTPGPAVESDLAQAITRVKVKSSGPATETDTARPVYHGSPPLGQVTEVDEAQPVGPARGFQLGQASEVDFAWIISSGPLPVAYTDDLVQGAVKMLTAQPDVLAVLGSYPGTVVPWLFQHTLWVAVEGTSSTAAVISRSAGWYGSNAHNTMRFPRLSLEIYVDPLRDANLSATDPGEAYRRAQSVFRVFDRHLQIVAHADQFWGAKRVNGSTRQGEPVVNVVPDGGGLLRLQVFYGVIEAGIYAGAASGPNEVL